MQLPDRHVAVAGDWHGDRWWVERAFRSVRPTGVQTLLHVGDFWPSARPLEDGARWLSLVDVLADAAGIERVLVTLGNHEPWPQLTPLIARDEAVQVSKTVWVLPRPYRLSIGGRVVLSLGGASSVNAHQLTAGVNWFADELITDAHVATAVAGGPADLMLTHESPEGTPVRAVAAQLRTSAHQWPAAAIAESAASRRRVTEVWDAVRPELLIHGHMHIPGGGRMPDGRRVCSLGADDQVGNLLVLDMATLAGDAIVVAR